MECVFFNFSLEEVSGREKANNGHILEELTLLKEHPMSFFSLASPDGRCGPVVQFDCCTLRSIGFTRAIQKPMTGGRACWWNARIACRCHSWPSPDNNVACERELLHIFYAANAETSVSL